MEPPTHSNTEQSEGINEKQVTSKSTMKNSLIILDQLNNIDQTFYFCLKKLLIWLNFKLKKVLRQYHPQKLSINDQNEKKTFL